MSIAAAAARSRLYWETETMNYVCPFCYKVMPQSAQAETWACCGETGHAIVLPACPKCSAEFFDPPKPCEVCGFQTTQTEMLRALGYDA